MNHLNDSSQMCGKQGDIASAIISVNQQTIVVNNHNFFKYIEPSRFSIIHFMESLILAQDERWRRA